MTSPQKISPIILNRAIKPSSPCSPRLQHAISRSNWEDGGKINKLVSSKGPLSPSQALGKRFSPSKKSAQSKEFRIKEFRTENSWTHPIIKDFRAPLTPSQTPRLTNEGIVFENNLLSNEERACKVNLLDNYNIEDEGLQFLKNFAFVVKNKGENNIEEIRSLLAKSKNELVWLNLPTSYHSNYFETYLHIYRNNQMVLIELAKKLSFPLDNLKSSFILLEKWFLPLIEFPPSINQTDEYNEWKTRVNFFLEEGISGFCDLEVQDLVKNCLSEKERKSISESYLNFFQ